MKKLVLIIFLIVLLSSVAGFSLNENDINGKISDVENTWQQYQQLTLNLNSQGAYTSKSIKLLSDMKDLIWQAKIHLIDKDFETANEKIEEAKAIAPKITLDIAFSSKINRGRLALEEDLSLINSARKEGYDVKVLEEYYEKASLLFNEAKELYKNETYDKIDSKIQSVLELTDKVSNKVEQLKEPNQVSEAPTGFMIVNYFLLPYAIVIIVITFVFLVILKVRSRKKELKGISKLVRIKSRLE